jgi:twitching motility protein PilI
MVTAAASRPYDVLADYERRSLSHVAGLPEQIEAPGLWRGIGFRLGTRNLAAGFGEVVEIITLPPLTPVPGAEIWLLGVANIRSNLLPVVDLKLFMEGERTVQHESTRALVVKQTGGNVAVLIDELFGQRNFTDANKTELDGIDDGRYGTFVKQAYRLGDTVWGVFSMALLARTPEFRQAAAA